MTPILPQGVYSVVMQMKIDSGSMFNGGSYGYTAVYATRSVIQVALTGYGYLY